MIGLGVGLVPRPFLDPTINRRYQVVSSQCACREQAGYLKTYPTALKKQTSRVQLIVKKKHTHTNTPLY